MTATAARGRSLAEWLAILVAVAGLAAATVYLARNGFDAATSPAGLWLVGGALAVAATGLGLLAAPASWRASGLVSLAAALAGALAVEGYLAFEEAAKRRALAGSAAAPVDTRTRAQVIADMRAQGLDAVPAIFPRMAMADDGEGRLVPLLSVEGRPIIPLGGIALATTVTCNETGRYAIVESDEQGFNNPRGLWEGSVSVVVLGDSFTYGNCVAAEDVYPARLRERFPRTLNLGLGGVGPLLMLAVLDEYVADLGPEVVVWTFYEGNDLIELGEEATSPALTAHLAAPVKQGLRDLRPAVDQALRAFAEAKLAAQGPPPSELYRWLTLSRLRARLGRASLAQATVAAAYDYALLAEVLRQAERRVRGWGGRLVFVYLPSRARYFGPASGAERAEAVRARVRALLAEQGITVIDIAEMWQRRPHPEALFVNADSHLSAEGYAVVGDAVAEGLRSLLGHEPAAP